MPVYEITSFTTLSDYEDKGPKGAFKFGKNLDVRKAVDSLSCGQALVDEGLLDYSESPSASVSPSATASPSASASPTRSPSASTSPSLSTSGSQSASSGISPSPSLSPSLSPSVSASVTPSSSNSPSTSPSSGALSIFDDLIRVFVKCKDGYTYGLGSTGHIYRRDSDGAWIRVYKDSRGAIKGAAEWYLDTGKAYLYWATDNFLMRKEIGVNPLWNDVETVAGNLTSADWHTMRESGGSLVICNGSTLALVGYDGSYTPEAVNPFPGVITKTLVERNGRAIIGTFNPADPTKGVNAAIDTEVPLAQMGDEGYIFYANMTDTIPVKQFPGGGKVNPGGVTNVITGGDFFEWDQNAQNFIDKQGVSTLSIWGVYGGDAGRGGLYTYGRKNKNKPFSLNLEYELDVDEIGAVVNVNGTILASYKDGVDFGVKAVDPTRKATGVYEGLDFKAPAKTVIEITQWMMTELFMDPLPSGASVEFWYRINKDGDFVRAKTADDADSYSIANGDKAVFALPAQGEIFEPRVVMNPTGNYSPEIHRIRTYFK